MKFDKELLDHLFTHHPPTGDDQLERYAMIREFGLAFARMIVAQTPEGPDQSAAIRKVREAVMTANAAIALGGRA